MVTAWNARYSVGAACQALGWMGVYPGRMGIVENIEQWKTAALAIRQDCAPTKHGPGVVEEVCEECSKTFLRWSGKVRHYCPECAAHRLVEANVQTALRTGPTYEKVVRGQLRYWKREAERLGIAR